MTLGQVTYEPEHLSIDVESVCPLTAKGRYVRENPEGCELAELMVAQSAGKPRPLTKFAAHAALLRPVHETIFDQVARKRWGLRGDPTKEKLRKAGFKRGLGVLVSGDYASATDNLSIEVAEAILRTIFDASTVIPSSVQAHAMAILRPRLFRVFGDDIEVFCPTIGQMMGSFLSFPLLCLQNFLAFTWARESFGMKELPLMINGDDILFQSPSSDFTSHWMNIVKGIGLEVERTKTSIAEEFGTLNSTLFRWSGEYLDVVQTLRFGMLRAPEVLTNLGTSFHSFLKGQATDLRWRAARTFFSWHLSSIRSVRLTVDELGFRGSLAFRMARIFGVCPPDLHILSPPLSPVNHSIVLFGEVATAIPKDTISECFEVLRNREMASVKFSLSFQDLTEKAGLRYALALSMIRRPDTGEEAARRALLRSRLTVGEFSWRAVRKRYFRPSFSEWRLVPVPSSILDTQCIDAWADGVPPPPYSVEIVSPEVVDVKDERVVIRSRAPDVRW